MRRGKVVLYREPVTAAIASTIAFVPLRNQGPNLKKSEGSNYVGDFFTKLSENAILWLLNIDDCVYHLEDRRPHYGADLDIDMVDLY